MATTMLTGNPRTIGVTSQSWEQDPNMMVHLSPNQPYEVLPLSNFTVPIISA